MRRGRTRAPIAPKHALHRERFAFLRTPSEARGQSHGIRGESADRDVVRVQNSCRLDRKATPICGRCRRNAARRADDADLPARIRIPQVASVVCKSTSTLIALRDSSPRIEGRAESTQVFPARVPKRRFRLQEQREQQRHMSIREVQVQRLTLVSSEPLKERHPAGPCK